MLLSHIILVNAFEKKLGFDVDFLVGPENALIQGHRIVIGSASHMFNKMLFGNTVSQHPFPDCNPKAVQCLIEVCFCSFNTCLVNIAVTQSVLVF